MSIITAKCPCCGRDIGFDKNAAEYTCIFCGARLRTSALKSEEVYRPGEAVSARPQREGQGKAAPVQAAAQPAAQPAVPRQNTAPVKPAEGVTEEERSLQLKRKAEFKAELKKTVKQIDDMRERKPKLSKILTTTKSFMIGGAALAVAAVFFILVCIGGAIENPTFGIVASALALAVGFVMMILSAKRGRETKEEIKRLEKNISERKEKRDVLIGRLNKINERLGIHHEG